ncbi:MAG: NADH-quinone oxidoreductase subunit NuoH [Candidatus Latescibacterota bacterium]|jgi:NADH-quinone oxidoreductase subunit H
MDIPLWATALIAFALVNMCLIAASALVYAERRVAAFIQERVGPNRVGPIGLLQPFADVLKLFMKEDIRPTAASSFLHSFAPFLMVVISMSVIAVIPLARGVMIADIGVGVLVILAMTSMSVYGVTLAGWSSNSKYALLGGLRSSAQMISYELSMGAAVVSVVLIAGSLNLSQIVEAQGNWLGLGWNAFKNPIGFIIFVVTAFAETNRAPFDLPEAEQELVGGYHTEYSGMKFGMFFLAEYVNMFIASFVITTLFLGGYIIPFEPLLIDAFPSLAGSIALGVLQHVTLLAKVALVCFFFIWVRWTFPRFKYNQLMTLGWKYLLPIALINILLVAIGVLVF